MMKKKLVLILLSVLLVFMLAACGNQADTELEISQDEAADVVSTATPEAENEQASEDTSAAPIDDISSEQSAQAATNNVTAPQAPAELPPANAPVKEEDGPVPSEQEKTPAASKTLVAYFSRAGENYGVGVIEKGNTEIVAEMIADAVGADTFRIRTVNAYPEDYAECTAVARQERDSGARPELASVVTNFADYDVIYLGYPIWYGDMPMAVYTFLESCDFTGKTIIPFCTHAGSGLSGTVGSIQSACSGAVVLDGLAVAGTTAQNDRDAAKRLLDIWLDL